MGFFNPGSWVSGLVEEREKKQDLPFLFGRSQEGAKASGLIPQYLRQAAESGMGLGDFFSQAFSQIFDPRRLNAQLGPMGQTIAGQARKARTSKKYSTPVAEALASGIETGGAAAEQQARLADQQQQMNLGMQLAQAFSGAVTNPLLNILGIGTGAATNANALAEQARQFNASQPTSMDKALGFISGIFCWTARAVLQDDRWLAAREYLIHEGSPYLKHMYLHHGDELAYRVERDPALREELTPIFTEMARRGAKYLE